MSLFRDLMIDNVGYDRITVRVSSGSELIRDTVKTLIVSGGSVQLLGRSTTPCTVKTLIVSGGSVRVTNWSHVGNLDVNGGRVNVELNVVDHATVWSGGYIYVTVYNRWEPDNVMVQSGGRLIVNDGGTLVGATVTSGGILVVSSGGTALAVTSMTGATITVASGGYIEYA